MGLSELLHPTLQWLFLNPYPKAAPCPHVMHSEQAVSLQQTLVCLSGCSLFTGPLLWHECSVLIDSGTVLWLYQKLVTFNRTVLWQALCAANSSCSCIQHFHACVCLHTSSRFHSAWFLVLSCCSVVRVLFMLLQEAPEAKELLTIWECIMLLL